MASPSEITSTVDRLTEGLTRYLDELGLPAQAVLTPPSERIRVLQNLPSVTTQLTSQQRAEAYYISKFVAACGVGLFDAALNFLWNEVISNLRDKVARFDLDYFLDSIVSDPRRRASIQGADDLDRLEDWELIKGCMETGIIGDLGFKHLDYIRNMRNYASAAHPNQNELTGLQLASWLETCIREVLSHEPEGGVVEIRKLLRSLREEALRQDDVPAIEISLGRLSDDLARSLIRAVFGMYTDPRMAAEVRNNISLVASPIWQVCPDDVRYELGVKHSTFAANGEVARRSLAHQFLEAVTGLAYLPADALAGELESALADLSRSHSGFNNFYNEPGPARLLAKLVPANGRIPVAVEREYVKVLLLCRIGNGYGVSDAAVPTYDELIGRWSERHALIVVRLVSADREVGSRLQFQQCAGNLKTLAASLNDRLPNGRLRRALAIITATSDGSMAALRTRSAFKDAVNALPSS